MSALNKLHFLTAEARLFGAARFVVTTLSDFAVLLLVYFKVDLFCANFTKIIFSFAFFLIFFYFIKKFFRLFHFLKKKQSKIF